MALTLLSALLVCIPAVQGLDLPGWERTPSTLPRSPARESLLMMPATRLDCFESEQMETRFFESQFTTCQDLQSNCAAHNHPVRTSCVFIPQTLTNQYVLRNFAVLQTRLAIDLLTSPQKSFAASFPAPPMCSLHALHICSSVLLGLVAVVAQSVSTATMTCASNTNSKRFGCMHR